MLKALTAFLTGILLSCSLSANVIRVNSNLATDAAQKLYKTLQEAHNAAGNGDTLMVEGSPVVYSSVTITKPLVLFGPGYFLAENPQTQANPGVAAVQTINIKASGTGTLLAGLLFSSGNGSFTPVVEASNVIIMRCYLNYSINLVGQLNNIQMIQNYFNSDVLYLGNGSYTFIGLVFKSNIVKGSLTIDSSPTAQRTFSSVENNIFQSYVDVTTSNFRSNIETSSAVTVIVVSGNIQNNLVSSASQLTNGTSTQVYTPANLFVGATGNSPDGQYKLKAGSPYISAGYNNAQPGVFGGTQPYVLSGLPPIPSIYEFSADAFGSKQNGLPISIKVKANQ